MRKELKPEEVIYSIDFDDITNRDEEGYMPEYSEVLDSISQAIEINSFGYNLFIIDDYSKAKLEYIMNNIQLLMRKREKPKDICYAIDSDEKCPRVLFVLKGKGKQLQKAVLDIRQRYMNCVNDFYNSSSNNEKEEILNGLQKKRNEMVAKLIEISQENGFEIKPGSSSFAFLPIRDGTAMTEKEYDELGEEEKNHILDKISELKKTAEVTLEELSKIEEMETEKLREIFLKHFEDERQKNISGIYDIFCDDEEVIKYLKFICEEIEKKIVSNYSMSYEDDEEKINEYINKFSVNVIVDNSENDCPKVIYEEDPNIVNLIGSIEYESHGGTYNTDISLIKAGSILKANEGCLIIRASSLLTNSYAYYYLKKTIMSGKVSFDYNKGYLDLLSVNSLKPEAIPINVKVVIIGDYEMYNLLYNYDEDFRKIFAIRAENNPVVDIDSCSKKSFVSKLSNTCKELGITYETQVEKNIAKHMSRKIESRHKILLDGYEISKIITLASNIAKSENRNRIIEKDVEAILYKEEAIEKEIMESYKQNKMLINLSEKKVGQINGLSVIDIGYICFGKPIRITCTNQKGQGNIYDVQKESDLSGSIHKKSINILKGYINNVFGGYYTLPVDFYLSFEQVYGKIEGDSASVAEIVSMLSALSKVPIKQNIAVTGSINQFGEVQPVGGVNEKIEGFYKTCKLINNIKDKGVIIPESNKNDLVLNEEIEEQVKNNNFHIYTVTTVMDAVEILMGDGNLNSHEIVKIIQKEVRKYGGSKRKS